jgi:hypothetical protein
VRRAATSYSSADARRRQDRIREGRGAGELVVASTGVAGFGRRVDADRLSASSGFHARRHGAHGVTGAIGESRGGRMWRRVGGGRREEGEGV